MPFGIGGFLRHSAEKGGRFMNKNKKRMATKTLAYCALLAALSVVLARLFALMPEESARFSLEAVPIYLAGVLFGPLAGGLVGFSADFVGCLFSPFGYNPLFCVPPILYGVFGGLAQRFLLKKVSISRILITLLPPIVLGSIVYQSFTLAFVYYSASFWEGLALKLSTRSVQFAVMLVLDTLALHLLFKAKIFERIGIWPPINRKKG